MLRSCALHSLFNSSMYNETTKTKKNKKKKNKKNSTLTTESRSYYSIAWDSK